MPGSRPNDIAELLSVLNAEVVNVFELNHERDASVLELALTIMEFRFEAARVAGELMALAAMSDRSFLGQSRAERERALAKRLLDLIDQTHTQ